MRQSEIWEINLEGEEFSVLVNYRPRRSLGLRYDGQKKIFTCNVPTRTSRKNIEAFLSKYGQNLKRRVEERTPPKAIEGDFVYLFGERKEIPSFSSWKERKQKEYLKKTLLSFLEENVSQWAKIMKVQTPYQIKIRPMKSRWGVNNKTKKSLTFSLLLLHYSKEIIESVVIHELAHDFVMNHSQDFYSIVYHYCPDYRERHAKLRKGKHA